MSRVRFMIAVMIFLGTFSLYMLRVNFSVVVVEFGDNFTKDAAHQYAISVGHVAEETVRGLEDNFTNPESWDVQRGTLTIDRIAILLSIYSYGYSLCQISASVLEYKLGGRMVVGLSAALAAVITILCPQAYEVSYHTLVAARFIIGCGSGVFLLSVQKLLMRWSPMRERKLFALALFGSNVGIIATFPISGILVQKVGWYAVMYATGTFVLVWILFWILLVTDDPLSHPLISMSEVDIILHHQRTRFSESFSNMRYQHNVPWSHILQSPPIIALTILVWASSWNLYFFMDFLPLYFNIILNGDMILATSFCAVPIFLRSVTALIAEPIAECLIQYDHMTITRARKFWTIFSHILPGTILLFMTLFIKHPWPIIISISIALGFNGCIVAGGLVNSADLSLQYADRIYFFIQMFSNTAGIIVPFYVAYFLNSDSLRGWHMILMINAILYLVSGVLYFIFGMATRQSWDIRI